MATLALYAVGSYVGGAALGTGVVAFGLTGAAIGGAIGSTVGAYIDANYLFPPKGVHSQGPRVTDYNVQQAKEGAGLNKCYGPENKVTGNVIWMGRHTNSGNPDLTVFEERKSTKKVGGKGGGSKSTQTTYTYFADFAVAVAEGKINAIRQVWADAKVIYTTGVDDSRYEALYLHTGSEDAVGDSTMTNNSSPNSHIEAFEGAGNVPKYKGVSYVVFDSLQLTDWGNRLPSINCLVEVEEQKSVRATINDILARAGLDPAQYDTSRVKPCLTGYYVTGPIQSTRVLEPILQAYDILVAEVDSVLHFFHRGDEFTVNVDSADLGSIDGAFPVQFSEIADFDKPSAVAVNFIDANNQYDPGEELERLLNPTTPNQDTIEIPLVITPDLAATIAKRRLYRAQIESLEISLRLPPSYLHITEGDILTITLNSEDYTALVINKARGQSGSLEIKTRAVDPEVNILTAAGSTWQNTDWNLTPYVAPDMFFDVFSISALVDSHALAPTYYVAAAIPNSTTTFLGATDYEAPTDTTASFDAVEAIPGLSVMGICNTTLGDCVSPHLWDYANTVDVTVYEGTLESVSVDEVAAGKNHCLIGNEIVGFKNATLVGTNQYRLDTLLRGRRNTEFQTGTHSAGERFIFFDSGSLLANEYTPAMFGSTRYHRVVSNGQAVADVTSDSVVLSGDSVKPFSPTQFTSSRDGSNNLTINWMRRTRAVWDLFSAVAAPLYEGQEVYEIDILAASGSSTVLRTITVADATTTTYTAAQQTTDGLTPGDPVYAIAYMVDASYGRGWPTVELTL